MMRPSHYWHSSYGTERASPVVAIPTPNADKSGLIRENGSHVSATARATCPRQVAGVTVERLPGGGRLFRLSPWPVGFQQPDGY